MTCCCCCVHTSSGTCVSAQCSEELATICAMVSVGNAIFYRPKDKAVYADEAKKNFHRGGVGDHIALMNVYNGWAEDGFSQHYCFANYVQVRELTLPMSRLLTCYKLGRVQAGTVCCMGSTVKQCHMLGASAMTPGRQVVRVCPVV